MALFRTGDLLAHRALLGFSRQPPSLGSLALCLLSSWVFMNLELEQFSRTMRFQPDFLQ